MLVEIPGGQAELRTKPTVAGRELLQETMFEMAHQIAKRIGREPVFTDIATMDAQMLGGEAVKAAHRFNRAAVVALLKSWSLPQPLPNMDTIGDIETDLYDALMKAVAPYALPAATGEDFKADPTTFKDPSSPTVPSSGSKSGERAPTTSTPPTSEPSDSSENTSFAPSFT